MGAVDVADVGILAERFNDTAVYRVVAVSVIARVSRVGDILPIARHAIEHASGREVVDPNAIATAAVRTLEQAKGVFYLDSSMRAARHQPREPDGADDVVYEQRAAQVWRTSRCVVA